MHDTTIDDYPDQPPQAALCSETHDLTTIGGSASGYRRATLAGRPGRGNRPRGPKTTQQAKRATRRAELSNTT